MPIQKKYNYLLFGNPVHHSKSPIIYKYFSHNTGLMFDYNIKQVENNMFSNVVLEFFKTYGQGANVTVPFKEEAYKLSHIVTRRAQMTHSVNVLKKLKNNIILGDNTDGIGCLYDLNRLNFIHMNQKILLIGAGGAARGIIPNLLSLNCSIDIVNRTFSRALHVASYFKKFGFIKAIRIDDLKVLNYHVVINATSAGIHQECSFFLDNTIFYPERTVFYDLFYDDKLTPFLQWYQDHGGIYYADGIGMLVSQAAYSFYLWNGIFPNVQSVINLLNKNKKYFCE
ncbi:Shikimate dehydrogenase (NADP(+)) [Buchnera aphidicola (Takecallis arundicolens)]|uniref:shikimate dehydrogenase n=1 Tax=Buchnera aphidicola TaxID=9 RepID=UPI0034648CC8